MCLVRETGAGVTLDSVAMAGGMVGLSSARVLVGRLPQVVPQGCSPFGCNRGVPMSVGGPLLARDFQDQQVSIQLFAKLMVPTLRRQQADSCVFGHQGVTLWGPPLPQE
jgi:hypothetical protein